MAQKRFGVQNIAAEWAYVSEKAYKDPFNDVELDVEFTDEAGGLWRIPAFWAGGNEWRIRFAPPHSGKYEYRTICPDRDNSSLDNLTGQLEAAAYEGDNKLFKHGPVRAGSSHYFEHEDHTPFFWLGDTWWFAACNRISWPDDFQYLASERKKLGFTVVQMFAGMHPDTGNFDARSKNEAGFSWEEGYARINPAYYDLLDLKIQWLVRTGIVPCIYGSQGYYYMWMGPETLKKHWRNLIARYGAYPVIWCLAGETTNPYYMIEDSEERDRNHYIQKKGWTETGRYVHDIDPYKRMVTSHPMPFTDGRDDLEDTSVIDFDLLQCGHGGYKDMPAIVDFIQSAVGRSPGMPVVNGEVNYEGLLGRNWEDLQRFQFWSSWLSGTAGFTYGADGIMQANAPGNLFGPSPYGTSWGNTVWQEACRFKGAAQVCAGKRLLERYEWWRFKPQPELIKSIPEYDAFTKPYCAGIPGEICILYFHEALMRNSPATFIKGLKSGTSYTAFFMDPRNGQEYPLDDVCAGAGGEWKIPLPPIMIDWVLVLERKK